MLARLLKPPVLNLFSSMSPVINRAAFIASMSTSSDQKIIEGDDSAEEDEEKSALVRSIMKKLKGPLADENGHIPTGSQRPIAIEVDGPAHFYVNTTKYTAYTKLKHRLLTRMGYKVLHVPYFEWRKLKGAKDRRRYLEEKLREEPTEWLDPDDEKIYADRMAKAEEALASKPPPPKGPRPTRRK